MTMRASSREEVRESGNLTKVVIREVLFSGRVRVLVRGVPVKDCLRLILREGSVGKGHQKSRTVPV